MKLQNIKIGPRLIIGFAFVGFLLLVQSLFALSTMSGMHKISVSIEHNTIPSLESLAELNLNVMNLRSLTLRTLITETAADAQSIRGDLANIDESAIRVASFGSPGNLALTRREKECLAWASEGKTTAEIAAILGITPRTVTYYIQQVLGKTHSTNRDQAIAKAMAGGVLLPSLDVDVDNVY